MYPAIQFAANHFTDKATQLIKKISEILSLCEVLSN
jgi:hypothetical protein